MRSRDFFGSNELAEAYDAVEDNYEDCMDCIGSTPDFYWDDERDAQLHATNMFVELAYKNDLTKAMLQSIFADIVATHNVADIKGLVELCNQNDDIPMFFTACRGFRSLFS